MNTIALALRNIKGASFRSLAIFLCVMGVAGFLLSTTLIIKGAEYSLDSGLKRMGADIIVVPSGAEQKVETALLMGKPTDIWMPAENLNMIAAFKGVEAVSPQIYLESLYGAESCSASEMYIVVYDPNTDFAVTPWLQRNLGRGLEKGEAVGGVYVFVPTGKKNITLYNYELTLKGNLEATGTGIDQTLFITMETAQEMAKSSAASREGLLEIPSNSISTIMVRVAPGADSHKLTLQILRDTIGMVPIESPNLFGTFRKQTNGLLWGFFAITVITWVLSGVLIALIFTMAANERRREMAVLRALGASRRFIFQSVLAEAAILAISGAIIGIVFAALGLYVFKDIIAGSLKMPFLFPSTQAFLILFGLDLAVAIVTVTLSAAFPAIKTSRQEAAIAMRE